MLYRLIVLTGPLSNQRITVAREPMTLGHAPDCQLVLPDDEVAAKHAVLEDRGEGGLHIRDLGTMHKILVNSREVRQSRLKHGDMVEIGRTRFLVQAVVAADVSGKSDDPDERMSPKLVAAVAVVLLLGVITWWRWPQTHPDTVSPPKAEPEPPVLVAVVPTNAAALTDAVTAVEAVAQPTKRISAAEFSNAMAAAVEFAAIGSDNQTTQMTAEIQKMRADLADMHEKIKSISPVAVIPEKPIFAVETSAPPVVIVAPISPLLVVTSSPPVVVVAETNARPVVVVQNTQPPTNLPVRPDAVFVTNIAQEVAALPVIIAPTGRVLRVLNVEQSRFPASDDYDDMRTFNIVLSLANPRYEITNPDINIEIAFYDEDLGTGAIKPAASVQPAENLRPTQAWGADRRCTISANYVLPKGARLKEKTAGLDARYYGFTVRVTYRGLVQDEWALPRSLLKNTADATATNGIKSAQANLTP